MNAILTSPDAGDLVLPEGLESRLDPAQTPITSERRIKRIRQQPATVGFVDDEVARLAKAMLTQYGPLAHAMREMMVRQMALEDFCAGEIELDEMKARIAAAARSGLEPDAPADVAA